MKMRTRNELLLKFFHKKNPKKEIKLKTPRELEKLLEVTKKIVHRILEERRLILKDVDEERDFLAKLI